MIIIQSHIAIMAEQPPKKPETLSPEVIDKGSSLNVNDFQKLQEAKMTALEKIFGSVKNGGPKSFYGTVANNKQDFAPLSINKGCPFNSVDWDMTGHLTGTASARAKRLVLYIKLIRLGGCNVSVMINFVLLTVVSAKIKFRVLMSLYNHDAA